MIVFYFQHRGYGGVPSLIVNFIRTLHVLNHRVKLFSYENDVIDTALKDLAINNYELIDLDKTAPVEYANYIKPDDVLVVTNFYVSLAYFFKVNPCLFYYNVYPDALAKKSFHRKLISSKQRNAKLVQELQQSGSLAFMDDAGVKSVQALLGMTIENPQYFPVSVEVPASNKFLTRPGNMAADPIRVSYVGRSVAWKNNSVKKIIDDISRLQRGYNIIINIVVDDKKSLENFIRPDSYSGEKLQINIYENIPQPELGQFLLDHSDLHFGMGTTALEGAKMGIPTVLIDFSHRPFPENYGYQWLYQTQNYCLGDDIETGYYENRGKHSMEDLVKSSLDKDTQATVSASTYDYVLQEHQVEKNIQKLVAMTDHASFRLKSLKYYIPHYFGWYRQLKRIYNIFANSK